MTGAQPARVLIVEDGEDVLLALQIVMESAGHAVLTATTCAEAIAVASETPIDVMLLDLTLPDGDGLSALTTLREDGHAPRTTLALTGRDGSDVYNRCLQAGCADVLVKPVPMRALMARVTEAIRH